MASARKASVLFPILSSEGIESEPRLFDTEVYREVQLQSRCRHKNILRLHDFFEDPAHLYMLLECAPLQRCTSVRISASCGPHPAMSVRISDPFLDAF